MKNTLLILAASEDGYEDVRLLLIIVGVLVVILFFAFLGRLAGKKRNNPEGGAALGALFGPIGLVGTILLPDKRRQCPACKGRVPDDARKCMHCGEALPEASK